MTSDLAQVWQQLARSCPDRPAITVGTRTLTWAQFDTAAAGAARLLVHAGVQPGDPVALCLPNMSAYLILFAAALRCGAAPCGVNYRYRDAELVELLQALNPAVVVLSGSRSTHLLHAKLPRIRRWYRIGGPSGPGAEHLSMRRMLDTRGPTVSRSFPDAVLIKCTGGTTGAPAPIRWRVADVLTQINENNPWYRHDLRRAVTAPSRAPVRLLVAGPLIHGSGLTRALGALTAGGTVVLLRAGAFDAGALLDTAEQHLVTCLAIVGDAHAVPIADALHAHPGRWNLSSLQAITSSGTAWNAAIKARILRHQPHLLLLESFGSTEATGLGFSTATIDRIPQTGVFELGRHAAAFTGGFPAEPGDVATIGVSRPHPTGGLPADRFVDHDGLRYLLSGDIVQLLGPDRFRVLGRPAQCINSGGEKVWAPEIADALTRHPLVRDAAVVGIPDARFGQRVAAAVVLEPGGTLAGAHRYVSGLLAGFKAPAVMAAVDELPRTTAGKVDLQAVSGLLEQAARSPGQRTHPRPACPPTWRP